MVEKLGFGLLEYTRLVVFATAAWGLSQPLTRFFAKSPTVPLLLALPLRLATGTGLFMVLLFFAGSIGYLNVSVVAVLVLTGVGLAAMAYLRRARSGFGYLPFQEAIARVPKQAWWWVAVAVVGSLPYLLRPLQIADNWDDISYHLPLAQYWAQHGALAVNEWLRYPLLPSNMNLLYAAALVFKYENLPLLLHAFTGALTAMLTFALASRYIDWRVGLIAVIGLLRSTRWGWSTAFVDLGVMLFWFSAFSALALRHSSKDHRFSYLAAFFGGIAVGIKYQALFYLPVFAVVALVVEKQRRIAIMAILIFVVVGGNWYLRSYLISGDPIHPMGGHVFGFWLWNADDLVRQYGDFEGRREWPPWFLLLAIGSPLFWRGSSPLIRGLMASTGAAVVTWYFASHYTRYLVAIYPMLALLSAYFLVEASRRSGVGPWLACRVRGLPPKLYFALAPIALVIATVNVSGDLIKRGAAILPDAQGRVIYLRERFGGYDLLRSLGRDLDGAIYQIGFRENYYLGLSVRGDSFGPGRYADIYQLLDDPSGLARHLVGLGADYLLVNRLVEPFSTELQNHFESKYFELLKQSDRAALYRIRPTG